MPLGRLRALMQERRIDAYLVPTADFHASEYTGAHFKARAFLSGFTGSAGTLALTQSWAGLWTDGRYFLQAGQELRGTGIALYRMGEPGVEKLPEALLAHMPAGGTLGVDGRTISAAYAEELQNTLAKKRIALTCDLDLAGEIWADRPPLPAAPAWVLARPYTGKSAKEKLQALRTAMREAGATHHLLTTLDDIAWLLNIRGGDIEHCPLVLAYALIGLEGAMLFLSAEKAAALGAHLQALGVQAAPYAGIEEAIRALPEDAAVLLDPKRVNSALVRALGARRQIPAENPTTRAKAIKNDTERANLRLAHEKDGIALCRFLHRIKTAPEGLTECSAGALLDGLRREEPTCLGPSFTTIAAYGTHGAIVHYAADAASDVPLERRGFLLVDSGGHYLEGTTDVTRTIALGPLDAEAKRDFTRVLQGMLRLAHARFPAGTRGDQLDAIARGPLWAEGLDYRHGTGHGVGYLTTVHEGPISIRHGGEGASALAAGMILSDEPGLYREGKYGIRIENQLACIEGPAGAYGAFLAFETLTLAPIDRDAIAPALLSSEERHWLDAYHARVYDTLGGRLPADTRAWLAEATKPI